MRRLPPVQDVRHYLQLGLRVVPPGDSEPRCRLLVAKAFWPWTFVGLTPDETMHSLEAGNEAADMALRIGRADLASGALDGVSSILMTQERSGDVKNVITRRLDLLDRIEDPFEVGDILALAAWGWFDLGLYREALEFAARGYERTVDNAPSVALHSQSWLAMARFRLGRWDGFAEDFDVLERMLGDRRSEPPYFAVRPFGVAAMVFEAKTERAEADRMLAVVEWMRGQEEARGSLALAFASLALARRGDVDAAWRYSDDALTNRMAYGPAVLEARCDLVAETGLWERTPATLASARAATDRGGLLALPAFADRLEGRAAFVEGETETATRLLEQASRRFEEIGARWERACTDLSLAEALLEEGDRAAATSRLKPSLGVFDEVGSLREAARARELLEP